MKREKLNISAEKLKLVLRYEPETGHFWWLRSGKGRDITQPAGKIGKPPDDYVAITIDGTRFYAHRLAWLYIHGFMPTNQIDHINLTKFDNRLTNLREATRSQNQANKPLQSNSMTKLKGVTLHQGRYWLAQISVHGKSSSLGIFPSAEEAHAAYVEAAKRAFGEFHNPG